MAIDGSHPVNIIFLLGKVDVGMNAPNKIGRGRIDCQKVWNEMWSGIFPQSQKHFHPKSESSPKSQYRIILIGSVSM